MSLSSALNSKLSRQAKRLSGTPACESLTIRMIEPSITGSRMIYTFPQKKRSKIKPDTMGPERGIPHNPEQHAAYVGSWIKALKQDKNEIFRAAHDASRAADFLVSLERDRSIADEALATGPDLPSETSAVPRSSVAEQDLANLQRDCEDLEGKLF